MTSPIEGGDARPAVLALAGAAAAGLAGGVATATTPSMLAAVAAVAAAACVVERSARGSRTALATLLAVAAILPCLRFRDRDIGAIDLDPQNAAKLVVWAATGSVAMLRWRSWAPRLADGGVRALWLYVVVAAPTILVSPVPAYSAASLLGLAATLAFAATAASELPERVLAHVLLVSVGAYAGLGLAAALVAPDLALVAPGPGEAASRLRGLASHPNMLAKDVAGLGGAALVLGLRSGASRRVMVAVAAAAALAITLAASRSVLLASVAATGAWGLRWSRHRLAVVGLVAGGTASWLCAEAAGAWPGSTVSTLVSRTGDGADLATLTGRTDLWSHVLHEIGRHPFVGHGFNAAEAIIEPGWWGQREAGIGAHDMVLQSLLTTGVLGTLPLLAFLWIMAARAWRERECACRFVAVFLGVLGLTEVEFATHPVAVTLALFILVAVDAGGPPEEPSKPVAHVAPPRLPRATLPPGLRGGPADPTPRASGGRP